MSNHIPLHRERGLDPHMTYCPRCGDSNGVTVGKLVKAITAKGTYYTQSNRLYKLRKELDEPVLRTEEVEEGERVPGDICDACDEELATFKAEVEAGGVYWRCQTCTQQGVVKGHTELAKAVRATHGLEAPAPCGIEFENCHEHTPE